LNDEDTRVNEIPPVDAMLNCWTGPTIILDLQLLEEVNELFPVSSDPVNPV